MRLCGLLAQLPPADSATATWVLLALAVLGSATTIAVTLINGRQGRARAQQTEDLAFEVRRNLKTGNGHTLGTAVARLEDGAADQALRLDAMEALMREMRDASTTAAQVLHVHLMDSDQDRVVLRQLQDDWDAAKARILTKEDPDAR